MRTVYLDFTVKKIPFPAGAVRVELTSDSKKAFPDRAPQSMPGRNVGEAVEKLEKWSNRFLVEQTGITSRAVLSEV